MPVTVHALHGFLGRPNDWTFLANAVPELRAHDLHRVLSPAAGGTPWDWAREFNRSIRSESPEKPEEPELSEKSEKPEKSAQSSSSERALLGYSLGGRLALHALLDDPGLWSGAIIISANPGLADGHRKLARVQSDEAWALRFERDPWESLLGDWNAQEVFRGEGVPPGRRERDYRREDLAGSLRAWSLGRQEDLLDRLSRLSLSLLWIAGERDKPYRETALRIAERRKALNLPTEIWIAPNSAHRVPWETPRELTRRVMGFLQRLRGRRVEVRLPADPSGYRG